MSVRSSKSVSIRRALSFPLFFLSITAADCPCQQASTNAFIELPTTKQLPVTRVVYQKDPTPHIMGDGLRCRIVEVSPEELRAFVSDDVRRNRDWASGSLQVYRLHLEALEWLEGWMKKEGILSAINTIVDIKSLKSRKDIHHRLEMKRNSEEVFITDADLWIIIPDKNIVCIFRGHT